jgi:hypothetical protein
MAMFETNTLERDNLFSAAQLMPVVADTLTIAQAGEIVKRGTIVDANGAKVTSADAVYAIVAEDTDTTAGAKDAPVYLTGEFNEGALIAGVAIAEVKAAARKIGIFIKKNV